ncbi:MAG: FecR family protein [Marinirhabdus sp.]|nr:FecR family protein [Marinirhabdus sp.]
MDKNLLDKWLNGTHTAEDLRQLETDPKFAAYQKIDQYTKRIDLPAFDTEAALEAMKAKRDAADGSDTKVRTLPTLLKIAAVLAVIAATYVFFDTTASHTTTQIAETTTVQLPDASEVMINAQSELSFNENTWEEAREVQLTGEAYFKVAKGKTFKVQSAHGEVTVLGTQFNVIDREDKFSVSCFEGLVAVTFGDKQFELPAGTMINLVDETIEKGFVFVNKPTWIGNESSYDDVAIEAVINDLEAQYDIVIETQNIDVTLRFTGSFTHTDVNAALQTVTLPLGLTYAINTEDNVIISPAK